MSTHGIDKETLAYMEEITGSGAGSTAGQPVRPTSSTPAHVEHLFQSQRAEMMARLAPEIKLCENITGFCNDPISNVKLSVKPEHEKYLYILQYKIPQALMPFADKILKAWLANDRIELFSGDDRKYNCPLLLVPKRDNNGVITGVRVCIDPRVLNKYLVEDDHFEIPRINDMLAKFAGKRIFGEMDLAEAFMQFQLTPESRKYTSFTWNAQQYQFRSVPFGIKHIPSHFQRVMSHFFKDMPFCFPYIDNILFASDNWEEHEEHARLIIQRLLSLNLRLKPGSVNIGHALLKVLGRTISSFGVSMDEGKREMVMNWPTPQDGPNLHSLLGFCGFLADHVRYYADITAPLHKLKSTKGPIPWDALSLEHLTLLKRAIANAPWLKYPDFDREFFIACDASHTGIGGVLYQPDKGTTEITPHNIVAICSRKLTDTETRYSAYKKELRALVYCLMKFHSWITLRKFTCVTDHMPLKTILTQKQLSNTLQQWLDVIVQYTFDVIHRPGHLHVLPDALSRLYAHTYADSSLVWGTHNNVKFIETAAKFDTPGDLAMRAAIDAEPQPKPPVLRPRFPSGGGGNTAATKTKSNNNNNASAGRGSNADRADNNNNASAGRGSNADRADDTNNAMQLEDEQSTSPTPLSPSPAPAVGRLVVTNDSDSNTRTSSFVSTSSSSPAPAEGRLVVTHHDDGTTSCVHASSTLPQPCICSTTFNPLLPFPRNIRFIAALSVDHPPPPIDPDDGQPAELISAADYQEQEDSVEYGAAAQWNVAAMTRAQEAAAAAATALPAPVILPLNPSSGKDEAPPSTPSSPSDSSNAVPSSSSSSNSTTSSSPAPALEVTNDKPRLMTDEEKLLVAIDKKGFKVPLLAERMPLLERYHSFGHHGRDQLLRQLDANKLWWPGRRLDIEELMNDCVSCITHNITRDGYHPASSVRSSLPGMHWQFDLAHMPRTPDNLEWLLVAIDVFTGFVVLRILDQNDSDAIAKALWEIFSLLGAPKVLQCDNASVNTATVVDAVCNLMGIERRFITPYNPEANGKVESAIGKVKQMLAKDLHGADSLWPFRLCFIQMAYNTRVAKLTGSTPFSLMFNRKFNLIHDLAPDGVPVPYNPNVGPWQEYQDEVTSFIYPAVELRARGVQADYIKKLNAARRRVIDRPLPAGTTVVLKDERYLKGSPKPPFQPRYRGNEYTVVERTNNGAYVLSDVKGDILDRRVTLDMMKVIKGPRILRPAEDDDRWVVKEIIGHRPDAKRAGSHEYLIWWKDYEKKDATWEPSRNINDEELIRTYLAKAGINRPSAAVKRASAEKEKRAQLEQQASSSSSSRGRGKGGRSRR